MLLNARSIAKPDACAALYADLRNKNIDVCCISEAWLKETHMDHLICPQGFTILRKDETPTIGRYKKYQISAANSNVYGQRLRH